MAYCSRCGEQAQVDDMYCRKCGNKISIPPFADRVAKDHKDEAANIKILGYCKQCGRPWYVGDTGCRNCGGRLYDTPFSKGELSHDEDEAPFDPSAFPIRDSVAWLIAFMPLIGLVVENAIAVITGEPVNSIWWVSLLITMGLCWWDIDRVSLWYPGFFSAKLIFLVPVYLYKRAVFLKQSLAYFFVWLVTFAIVVFVPSQYILNNSLFNFGLGSASSINMVKSSYYDGFPDKSVGDAIDGYMDDEKWTSFTTDSGQLIVQVEGTIPGEASSRRALLLQFTLDKDYSSLNAGTINGKTLNYYQLNAHFQAAYNTPD